MDFREQFIQRAKELEARCYLTSPNTRDKIPSGDVLFAKLCDYHNNNEQSENHDEVFLRFLRLMCNQRMPVLRAAFAFSRTWKISPFGPQTVDLNHHPVPKERLIAAYGLVLTGFKPVDDRDGVWSNQHTWSKTPFELL